jgi:hypothetical protein
MIATLATSQNWKNKTKKKNPTRLPTSQFIYKKKLEKR